MNREMLRTLRFAAALLLLAGALVGLGGARQVIAAPATQAGAQQWTAMVGAEYFTEQGDKSSWQAMRFYPESMTINAGDTITWKHNSGVEPHTVTFPGPDGKRPEDLVPEGPPQGNNPPRITIATNVAFAQGGPTYDGSAYANSGIMAQGNPGPLEFKLTFPKAGTYRYFCVLHSAQLPDGTLVGMVGTVVVQEAGAALANTPAQVTAEGEAMMAADEARLPQLEAEAKKVTSRPGPEGSTIHTANAGYVSPDGKLQYMRFAPLEAAVKVGDTIEWVTPGPNTGFHTVTFGDEPDFLMIEPQQNGPPKLIINPLFFPAGDNVHTGTGYDNSGPIVTPNEPPGLGVQKYSLTFTQPGRYEYICITHYLNGMDATVSVSAAGGGTSGPGMPRTGDTGAPVPWLAFGALALLLATVGVAFRILVPKNTTR